MKILNLEQGTPEWLAARKGIPTASRAINIITPSGVRTARSKEYAIELCAECIDPKEESKFRGTFHTKRGNLLEDDARKAFEKATDDHDPARVPEARNYMVTKSGVIADQVGICLHDELIAGCSPDALLRRSDEDRYYAGLEIKCPCLKKHIEYVMEGGVPMKYMPQVHWSMVITGLPWVFMSFYPGLRPLIVEVRPSEFTKKVERAMRQFCAEYERTYQLVMERVIE